MRASGASELRKFSHFYILKLLFLSDTLLVQMTCLSAYMYRQISNCTDKTPKKHYGGGGGGQLPPPPPLATLMIGRCGECMHHILHVIYFMVKGK